MNLNGRKLIAQSLQARLPSVNVKLGTGTQPPLDADNALSGTLITNVTAAVQVIEAAASFTATLTFANAAVLNEVGLFDSADNMFDRFLLGGQAIVAKGKVQIEWSLEVV